MLETPRQYEVMRIPSLIESGYEVVDTATMSLTQRMIACLNNDKMVDVYLMGSDGVKVNACKFVLGSASPNLQTLLYQGQEGQENNAASVVNIPNSRAKTLRALVEFSCSDMLNTTIWADTEPVEIVEDMISLARLAESYALPNLKQQVSDVLAPCLEQLPSLACVAYNLVDTKTTPELHAAALDVLRKKPYQAFVKGPGGEIGGIACLSPDKLDTIFRDSEVGAEEIFLFQCLQEWKAANMDVYANVDQICRMVAQNLDFSAMHASDIEEIVLPSGMVDSGSLVSGLMTLAKAAEKKGISLRSSRRKNAKSAKASDASINSISRKGRRFKKPESTLSVGDDSTFASSGTSEERRDDNSGTSPAPAPLVQASGSYVSPASKKTRSVSFKKPNNFASRATKLLGSFRRPHVVKEDFSEQEQESETTDASLLKTPPTNKDSAAKNSFSQHDAKEDAKPPAATELPKERPKEVFAAE